jgi:ribosomal protein S18 acetylase RimI-like enzyme
MIALRAMTESEFERFQTTALEAYALERARNLDGPVEREREVAARQFADLLPEGVRSRGHYLWMVTGDGGEVVGNLWVYVEEDRKSAFIYDIEIEPEHRGKGYGKGALDLLEAELKAMGVTTIALNVFADNSVAINLYRKQGYRTTNFNMQKRI